MLRLFLLAGALLLGGLAAAPAAAQTEPDPYADDRVEPGTRIRIRDFNAARRYAGTLVSVDADSLVMLRRGRRFAYPLDAVSRIEVSEGRDRVRGGAIGAVIGLATGAVVGIAVGPVCGDDCGVTASDGARDLSRLGEVAAFAAGGAAAGGIAGWIFGPERWAPARLRRFRVEVEPAPAGAVTLGVRTTF